MNMKNLSNSIKKQQCYFCKTKQIKYASLYGKSCICKECFETKVISDTYLEYTLENSDIWVECQICKFRAKDITAHIKIVHNEKIENYKLIYGPIKSKEILDRVKGENNPGYNHGGKLSPFSKNNKNITEEQRLENFKTTIKTRTENGNNTTSLKYYLKKTEGDEIEAKELLSKRQTTFSLGKCIEKHGQELGLLKWQERQEKWIANIESKSNEEKLRINRLKTANGYSVSRAELEICELLNLPINSQICIDPNKGYVYDIVIDKKIIEYNGDYWHMNPSKYNENDYNGRVHMSAKEIWIKDKAKIDFAKSLGYEVLVIWEFEYKQDKQATIDKCKNFLIK